MCFAISIRMRLFCRGRFRVPLLTVIFDDDDGVAGVDDDRVMGTAPLGVVSGAVVGRGDGVLVGLTESWSV